MKCSTLAMVCASGLGGVSSVSLNAVSENVVANSESWQQWQSPERKKKLAQTDAFLKQLEDKHGKNMVYFAGFDPKQKMFYHQQTEQKDAFPYDVRTISAVDERKQQPFFWNKSKSCPGCKKSCAFTLKSCNACGGDLEQVTCFIFVLSKSRRYPL